MKSIEMCEFSSSQSFHDDKMLQDQASCERSQDQWSSVCTFQQVILMDTSMSLLIRKHIFVVSDLVRSMMAH